MSNIKILGTGCSKCNDLYNNTKKAVDELNLDIKIEKINDILEIINYGVMNPPAIVYNDKVISTGKVLSAQEIKEMLDE